MLKHTISYLRTPSIKATTLVRCVHNANKPGSASPDDFIASLLKRMDSVENSPKLPKDFDSTVDLSALDKIARPSKKAPRIAKQTADLSFDVSDLDEGNVFTKTSTPPRKSTTKSRFDNNSNNNRGQNRPPRRDRPGMRNARANGKFTKKPDGKPKNVKVNITEESFENKRTIKMQSNEFISTTPYQLEHLSLLSLHRDQSRLNNSSNDSSIAISYAIKIASNSNLPIDAFLPNKPIYNDQGKPVNTSEIVVKPLRNGVTVGHYTEPIVLQHTPFDKNFKFKHDKDLLKAMIHGQYPTLNALDKGMFVKKFTEKSDFFQRNSESIRKSLQNSYLNTADLAKKEQMLRVCSGLDPVSSLFK
ncbi:hypothetical protein ACO0RG_001445 [Hanseniaspora osmophila]